MTGNDCDHSNRQRLVLQIEKQEKKRYNVKQEEDSHDPKSRHQGFTKCSAPACDKCIQYDCDKAILNKCGVKSVVFPTSNIAGQPTTGGEAACCSKSCHKKLVKILEMTIKGIKGASENELFCGTKMARMVRMIQTHP